MSYTKIKKEKKKYKILATCDICGKKWDQRKYGWIKKEREGLPHLCRSCSSKHILPHKRNQEKVNERRSKVKEFRKRKYSYERMSGELNVCKSTILSDLKILGFVKPRKKELSLKENNYDTIRNSYNKPNYYINELNLYDEEFFEFINNNIDPILIRLLSNRGFSDSSIELSITSHKAEYPRIWYSKNFRYNILRRDGFKCLNPFCKKVSTKLHVHHIDSNKWNCNPSNLITVCAKCNKEANYNRKWHKHMYRILMTKRYNYVYSNGKEVDR